MAIRRAVFCMICNLFVFVSDIIGDHIVDAYSSTGLVMVLYVFISVSFVLPHFVVVRDLSILSVLFALIVVCLMCFE